MLIDSHCHFNFECFKHDQKGQLEALFNLGISKLIVPATDCQRWEEVMALAQAHNNIYFALGIHPHFLTDFVPTQLIQLKRLLSTCNAEMKRKCVALGEIGLDKLIETDLLLQESVFLAQLEIAEQLQLPVILHVVKMQSRVLQLLKKVKFSAGGVYHAFSGSEEIAREFIKLGFKLGVGGVITHPSATRTRETFSRLPLSSLVLETDAPDMPIYQQTESHNLPSNLSVIYKQLCALRCEPSALIEQQLYANTESIFSIFDD